MPLPDASVLVLASYMHDTSVSVKDFPKPGETIMSLGYVEGPGGKGSNQAVQCALCGVATALIGTIGSDDAGAQALAFWAQNGIDASAIVRTRAAGTGRAAITVDGRGQNTIVVSPGANALTSVEDVERQVHLIERCAVLVAQLEIPRDTVHRAFGLARVHGRITVLNAAPADGPLSRDLLALTDYLIVNEGEACVLAEVADDPLVSAMALSRLVARGVVLTRGDNGAVLYRRDEDPVAKGALPVVAVDTTGAGDSLVGAFAARLAVTGEAVEALAWGVAAGSLACLKRGAASSYAAGQDIVRQVVRPG
ncbi:ribokinase [Microvirga antarctica]|uniref:ribokinase n=1 Tax=Microvirga antarctica TaxID=2819233 RepID=UPI001B301679|nr:ribokinase [Microvirga antarctica]